MPHSPVRLEARAKLRQRPNGEAVARVSAGDACSTRVPTSVIRIRSAIVTTANPVRTRLVSISGEKPCAISTASVLPISPASDSIRSARRHSGLNGILSITATRYEGPPLYSRTLQSRNVKLYKLCPLQKAEAPPFSQTEERCVIH